MALDVQHWIEVLFDGVGGAALIAFWTAWKDRERRSTVQATPKLAKRRTLWMAVAALFFIVCLCVVVTIHVLGKAAPVMSKQTEPSPPVARPSQPAVLSTREKWPRKVVTQGKSVPPRKVVTTADEIKAIVVEQLQVDPTQVTPDANFLVDLGADPLDKVEIIMQIEVEYGMQIPDEDVRKIKTVGDLIDYVERREHTSKTSHPQKSGG